MHAQAYVTGSDCHRVVGVCALQGMDGGFFARGSVDEHRAFKCFARLGGYSGDCRKQVSVGRRACHHIDFGGIAGCLGYGGYVNLVSVPFFKQQVWGEGIVVGHS